MSKLSPGYVSGTIQIKMDSLALFRGQWSSMIIHRDKYDYRYPSKETDRQSECVEVSCDDEGNITVSVPACATVKIWGVTP